MAKIVYTVRGEWDKKSNESYDEFFKRTDKMFEAMIEESNKVDLSKTLVGVILSFPFADGWAHYRVTKDKPIVLEHIPISDAYTLPDWQMRGLNKAEITRRIKNDRSITKLFSKMRFIEIEDQDERLTTIPYKFLKLTYTHSQLCFVFDRGNDDFLLMPICRKSRFESLIEKEKKE